MHTPKYSETLTIRTDVTREHKETGQHLQPLSSPEEARSEYTSSSAPKTPSALQRTPPPTPVAKSPRHTSTLSPLSVSPPRPPSQFSNPHSRSKSPSIANLGVLSVVTQRLAQIEQSELATPASSTVSSSSVGTALRRAQTTQPTHQGRSFAEIEKLQEENAGESWSKAVETPTDASIVIPLPNPPNVSFSDAGSVRSAFRRNRAEHQSSPAPTPPTSPAKASSSLAIPVPTKLSEPAIREHVENPPRTLPIVGVEPKLAPLAELIKDTAAKHYDQTAGLGEQIIALQRDIHMLPNEIQVLLGQAVAAAGKRTSDSNSHTDNASLQKVASSVEELRKQILANSERPQMESLMKMFEDLQTRLASLSPILMEKLASIEQGQTKLQVQVTREAGQPSTQVRTTRDVPPSPPPSSPNESRSLFQDGSHHSSVDLSDIHSKLDELASLYKSGVVTGNIPSLQTADADAEKVCYFHGCTPSSFLPHPS